MFERVANFTFVSKLIIKFGIDISTFHFRIGIG
jgi:hypothetical protein